MGKKIERTLEELDFALGEILEGVDKNPQYSVIDKTLAHRKAKLNVENYIIGKAQDVGKTNKEFGQMLEDVWWAKGITLDNKTNITIEMYNYWMAGEMEKVKKLYSLLFASDRKATYRPSD